MCMSFESERVLCLWTDARTLVLASGFCMYGTMFINMCETGETERLRQLHAHGGPQCRCSVEADGKPASDGFSRNSMNGEAPVTQVDDWEKPKKAR